MKFIIGIISFVFCLVLAIPFIAYLALQSIGTEKLKPVLADAVMEKTGRELIINGEIEAEFSFTPTISIADVTLANPDWVKDGAMVQLDSVQISLDLQQLLQKKIIIDSVVVNGADIVLVKEANRNSWTFDLMNKKPSEQNIKDRSMKQMKKSLVNLEIGDITLNNSTIIYVDSGKKYKAAFPVINAALQPAVKIDGTAIYNGLNAEFDIQPKAANIDSLMDKPIMVSLTAAMKEKATSFKATGEVSSLQDTPTFDGKINGNIASLHHLNSVLPDGSLSPSDAIAFDVNTKASAEKLILVINSAQYGETTVKGKADILLNKKKPYITANVTVPSYVMAEDKQSTPAQPASGDAAPAKKANTIDLSGLNAFNGTFNVALDNLKKGANTLASDITAKAVLKDGRMSITNYSARAFGGAANGSAVVNGSGDTPSFSVKSNLTGYNVSNLLKEFTEYRNVSNGPVNAEISLLTLGKNSDALVQNLGGDIAYTLGETQIEVPASATKINAFLNILRGKQTEGKTVEVTCSVGKLKLNNGTARAETLLVDTPGAVVSAEGTVNIPNKQVAMTLSPRTKLAGLTDVTIPVKVSGSVSDLRFTPDAKGTLGAISKIGLSLIKDKSGISQLVGTALAENMKTANLPESCLKTLPQDTGPDLTTRDGLKKLEDDLKLQGKDIEKNVRDIRDDYKAQGKNIEKDIRNIRDNLKGLKDLF